MKTPVSDKSDLWSRALLPAVLVVALVALISNNSNAEDAKRELTQIKGDVYRFKNNFHFSVVIDTADGIVVTDPINEEAATWLKNEIDEKFNKPITHLIMSHHHADHATGGQVFGAENVIVHQNFLAHLKAGDVDTAEPTQTFDDTLELSVGGKELSLTWLGEGHGDDLIAMTINPERVAFVVDAVSPQRLPWKNFPRTDIDGLIGQISTIESLDFDILAPGHSALGTKKDVTDMREYVELLKERVHEQMKAGKSEQEILGTVTMAEYAQWGSYEQNLALNIQGMMAWLKSNGMVD